MLVLGVDPGTAVTGYGLVRCGRPDLNLVGTGCIKTNKNTPFADRLQQIYDGLSKVISDFTPERMALEDVFYSRNVKTALQIGHVRGVVLLAASNNGLEAIEYSPRKVKQAVTGNGDASKQQVQFMVQRILRLETPPIPFDVSDALALAICHCHRHHLIE
jgi:crossover junction endodeoxyribonuclease RuvC